MHPVCLFASSPPDLNDFINRRIPSRHPCANSGLAKSPKQALLQRVKDVTVLIGPRTIVSRRDDGSAVLLLKLIDELPAGGNQYPFGRQS